MSRSVPAQPTVGEIARRTGYPVHKIEYVIRSRNLQPATVAGNARVFSEADVAFIVHELDRIESDRSRGGR